MVSGSFTVGIDIDPCRLREAILNAFAGNYIGSSATVQKAVEQVIGDPNLFNHPEPESHDSW